MITLDLSILNQKGTPMFYSDITANRPAAGIAGRIFIATDSPYGLFRDTGSAWEQVAGSGGGGGISGSGAATQVAFWDGTSSISGSNNLWWDSTNNYFGINTNTPGNPLDVHGNLASIVALNQTTATNNTLLSLLNSGTPLWRIGNYYTSGANDFAIFDVVGALQQLTIVKTTGQTFIGAKTTASGRLVINSATADAHLQIVGANSPSIRIDNAGSGGTQRFAIGNATATNNFIQGSANGQFCITTASSGAMLFGMWQTTDATEVMRISTANNLLIGGTSDTGEKVQITGTARVSGDIRTQNGTTYTDLKANATSGLFLNALIPATYDLKMFINRSSEHNVGTEIGVVFGGFDQGTYVTATANISVRNLWSSAVFTRDINIATYGGTSSDNKFLTFGLDDASNSDAAIRFRVNGWGNSAIMGVTTRTGRNRNDFDFRIGYAAADLNTGTLAYRINGDSGNFIIGSVGTNVASAILNVDSTTKGFLPPRMTTTQKNAISSPAAGLVIYDTTLNKLCVYTTAWETITSI